MAIPACNKARPRFFLRAVQRAVVLVVALACAGDPTTAPHAADPIEPVSPALVVTRITCHADTRAVTVSCASADASTASASFSRAPNPGTLNADLILGGQNVFVTLSSTTPTYVGNVFSFNTTLTNLIGQKLGTTDGTTIDPSGVRVFFQDYPTATSGSGTIDFLDPANGSASMVDGFATFTASNQPYYRYAEVLTRGLPSASRNWRMHVPASVTTFKYTLYVSAPVQFPTGWIDVTPAVSLLKAGKTSTLTATVRDVTGQAVTGQAVSWSTSASAVATVDATGIVSAVADGGATITATSGTRTGRTTITVSTAAGATTTISGVAASLPVDGTSSITVQAKNAAGANMSVGGDVVALQASAGTLSSVIDNGTGTYSATLTSPTATVVSITGTINGATIGVPGTVTFTAGGAASIARSGGDAQAAIAGTAVPIAPAVLITDLHGNPVPGVTVSFAVTSGGAGAIVSGATATTTASGIARIAGTWTLGTAPGVNTLTATAGALTTTFTASGLSNVPYTVVKQSMDPQSATVNTNVAMAPSVLVLDQNGSFVSGATVIFAVATGGGTVTAAAAVSNGSGVATVGSWKLGTAAGASNNTLSALIGSSKSTFTATAVADVPATLLVNAGDAQSANVGGSVAAAPSVVVRDQFGNAVPGVAVTFSVTGGGGSATGLAATTDANGVASVASWTLGAGGAGCTAAVIAACSRNTLHAATGGGANPAVDFKAYVPPLGTPASLTYQAIGNATLVADATQGMLTKTFSINGSGPNGTGAKFSFTSTTSAHGVVTLAADGSFTYLGAPGYTNGSGTDDYSYTASDGLSTTTVTGALRFNVPSLVWFVQPGFPGVSTGTDAAPFLDLGAAPGSGVQSVAGVNDIILVKTGSGTAGGGTLLNGQVVYGQGAAAGYTWTASSNTAFANHDAVLTLLSAGAAPSIGAIALAQGNMLRGLNVVTTSSTAITGSGFGTLTVNETSINAASAQGLNLTNGTLVGSFSSITSGGGVNNVSLTGIATAATVALGGGALLRATGDAFRISGGAGSFSYGGTITNAATLAVNIAGMTGGGVSLSGSINPSGASKGISISGNAGAAFALSGPNILISSGATNAVDLVSNAGSTIDVSGGGIAIATTTGTGVNATGGGTLSITGAANTINATAGQALSLSSVGIGAAGLAFSSAVSGGGVNNALLANVQGTGSISLGNGSFSAATGPSVVISGGANAVSYAGSIAKTSGGQFITVANRIGGAITLSGNLTCTSGCGASGGAIVVTGVAGGSVTFAGASKILSTGALDAVALSSNAGGTIDFTNGGLQVTTSGAGVPFSAMGGGTVDVTSGANVNTLTAPSAQALNLNGVAIGAAGVAFDTVRAGGGVSNVTLSTTGNGPISLLTGSLSGASGTSFVLSGGGGNMTFGGTIQKVSSGQVITVSGRTGGLATFSGPVRCITSCGSPSGALAVSNVTGGTVDFSGPLKQLTAAQAANAGVVLTNNPGGTISFSGGGLLVTTNGANAFDASGGGTIVVPAIIAGQGNNTLAAVGGVALRVVNTTIDPAGLTFFSIDASNGANGIVLNGTGAGALTVTGNGGSNPAASVRGPTTSRNGGGVVTPGSGGVISGTTGAAVSLASTGSVTFRNTVISGGASDGIVASSVAGLALDNASITGNAFGYGVHGTSVAGFSMLHSDVGNNATDASVNGTSIRNILLSELSGSSNIQASLVHDANLDVFQIANTGAGPAASVTVSNSTFTHAISGNGILSQAFGSANVNLAVSGSTFSLNGVAGLNASTEIGQTGTATTTVTASVFTGNERAVDYLHGSSATDTLRVTGNNMQATSATSGTAVNVVRGSASPSFSGFAFGILVGTISTNIIGSAGTPAGTSGSATGNGIAVTSVGNGGATRVAIINNQIREYALNGMALSASDASTGSAFDARVQQNIIANAAATSLDGINGVLGALSTDRLAVCLNVGGGGSAGNQIPAAVRTGISLQSTGTVPPPTAVSLQAWNGTTSVTQFLTAFNQNAFGGAANIIFSNAGAGATTTKITACNTP